MQVELAYGESHLTVEVPDDADLVLPRQTPGLSDEAAAIRAALREPIGLSPLRDLVKADQQVVIVFSDITRPMPNDRVLPVLLKELGHIPRENILMINGLGTHRPNTPEELDRMLGEETARGYRIINHDAWDDDNLAALGTTSFGHPAVVNRLYCEADFKIVTGFVEPHLFAGFSGGPKGVLPGIAGFASIMDNHGFEMLNHPLAIWGETEGNPTWEEMCEVARRAEPDFLLNVTLNRDKRLTGVYAGDIWQAHQQAVAHAREAAMVPVEEPYDVVLTTNSGYPLDINLYQAVKGMSCAAQIVKQGGSILSVAECRNGVPEYGEYRNLVHKAGSVQGIMDMVGQPGFRHHDQWEAQLQAQIQLKAEVCVYSDGLSDDETRGMLMIPCNDIEATLAELMAKHGPGARLCVLPEGPQTIPYLASFRKGA